MQQLVILLFSNIAFYILKFIFLKVIRVYTKQIYTINTL